jgi:nucleoside triphosphatase YtkD
MKTEFWNIGEVDERELKFAVIVAKFDGKWIFVQHKQRETLEVPGGHREVGEDIDDTAARELFEETGAIAFDIKPICDYSVTNDETASYGRLFYADVEVLDGLPDSEIGKIYFLDKLPEKLTYPEIQPYLHEKVLSELRQMHHLETDRLILRRFRPEDWRDLHEYLSKEEVVQYEPYGVYNEEQSKQEAINRSKNDAFWAVCLKEDNKLIGNIYFKQQEPKQFMTWELGYVFNSSYFGKGYATESCSAILEYGFNQLEARRIIAMCNPKNTASWRLLERLKMRREGHLIKNIYFKCDAQQNPIWSDTYEYAILSEEWVGDK